MMRRILDWVIGSRLTRADWKALRAVLYYSQHIASCKDERDRLRTLLAQEATL